MVILKLFRLVVPQVAVFNVKLSLIQSLDLKVSQPVDQ